MFLREPQLPKNNRKTTVASRIPNYRWDSVSMALTVPSDGGGYSAGQPSDSGGYRAGPPSVSGGYSAGPPSDIDSGWYNYIPMYSVGIRVNFFFSGVISLLPSPRKGDAALPPCHTDGERHSWVSQEHTMTKIKRVLSRKVGCLNPFGG